MDYTARIVDKWGHLPHFRQSGNEWKASCPKCGESGHDPHDSTLSDRFHIHPPDYMLPIARGKCRKCGHFEHISSDQPIHPLQLKKLKQERDVHLKQIADRQRSRLEQIQEPSYWEGFHAGMQEMHREIWRMHGIEDGVQDLFSLGYNPNKVYKERGELQHGEALTIPYMRDYNGESKPINIAHRLLHTDVSGKYRYEFGVPAASFIVEPHLPMTGNVLVVEGAKKAMICWLYIGKHFDHIIGLPSADVGRNIADELCTFDQVSLFLDPDTYEPDINGRITAYETAKKINTDVLLVLPTIDVKPDDLLLSYDNKTMASDAIMSMIDSATKA